MTPLEQALYDQLAKEPREAQDHARDQFAYASEAGRCPRQIAYRIRQTPVSDPESLSTRISFRVGESLHEALQAALVKMHRDFRAEVAWARGLVHGRADGLYTNDAGNLVVLEVKTMHPMAFKYARWPKAEHELQGILSALALGAGHVHVVYLNKAAAAGEPVLADWMLLVNEEAAAREFGRLTSIVGRTTAGEILPREYEGIAITDPAALKFPCGYCSWRARCIADGQP